MPTLAVSTAGGRGLREIKVSAALAKVNEHGREEDVAIEREKRENRSKQWDLTRG
jgi:hypothetical protein